MKRVMGFLSERDVVFARYKPARSFRELPNFEKHNRINRIALEQHGSCKTPQRNAARKCHAVQTPASRIAGYSSLLDLWRTAGRRGSPTTDRSVVAYRCVLLRLRSMDSSAFHILTPPAIVQFSLWQRGKVSIRSRTVRGRRGGALAQAMLSQSLGRPSKYSEIIPGGSRICRRGCMCATRDKQRGQRPFE